MAKKIKRISEANPAILTFIIAEVCLEQAGIDTTQDKVEWLVAFANYHFNKDDMFRRGVMAKGNAGRVYLYSFMEHWVKGKMWEKYPTLKDYI